MRLRPRVGDRHGGAIQHCFVVISSNGDETLFFSGNRLGSQECPDIESRRGCGGIQQQRLVAEPAVNRCSHGLLSIAMATLLYTYPQLSYISLLARVDMWR
ncbi:MAG: hypothetical protein ACRCVE_02055 [Plesiomonas sp.]